MYTLGIVALVFVAYVGLFFVIASIGSREVAFFGLIGMIIVGLMAYFGIGFWGRAMHSVLFQ